MTNGTKLTPLAALVAARAIIADPARWTAGAFARTDEVSNPREVDPCDPAATCFCALGALIRVNDIPPPWTQYRDEIVGESELWLATREHFEEFDGRDSVTDINDGPEGHPRVLALYDRAIKKLEQA